MGRARSSIAAQTDVETLRAAALEVYAVESAGEPEEAGDFDGALDFCQPLTEDLGGDEGSDAWFVFKHDKWAVIGDLGVQLHQDDDALCKLSEKVGGVVVCAIDSPFGYATFAFYEGGRIKRRLVHEEGEFWTEGLPVKAERGHQVLDFDEDEAERIWSSYGLPTFEYDPEGGPFQCLGLTRS